MARRGAREFKSDFASVFLIKDSILLEDSGIYLSNGKDFSVDSCKSENQYNYTKVQQPVDFVTAINSKRGLYAPLRRK